MSTGNRWNSPQLGVRSESTAVTDGFEATMSGSNGNKKPTAAQIAKVRREGATWNGVREHFGRKWGSGKWTEILNEAGFDAGGAKLDGTGPLSKATYRGKPKPPDEKPKPKKPAAKTRQRAKAKS
jgi:hypothetical protein